MRREKAATTQALQAEVERLRREVEAKAQSLQGVRTRLHQLMGDAKERSVSLYSGCVVWGLGVDDSLAEWTGEEKSEVEGVLQSLQEWCQGIQRENQSLREEAARGRREASEAGEASKAALSDLREQVRGGEALLASKDRELSSLRDELASVQAQLQETLAAQSAAALSSRDATAQLQAQLATVQAEAGKRYRELGEEYNALVDQCQKLQQAAQPARLIRHADGDDLAGREDKSVLAQYAARLRLVAGNEAQHAVIARLGNINRA